MGGDSAGKYLNHHHQILAKRFEQISHKKEINDKDLFYESVRREYGLTKSW